MMDKFVLIGPDGIPHELDENDAINHYLELVAGPWHEQTMPELRQEVLGSISRRFGHHFDQQRADGSVMLASIYMRLSWGLPWFRNAHIWQRPRSMAYLTAALHAWAERDGPRLGDIVVLTSGTRSRFTADTPDGIQAGGEHGSYHIYRSGIASYSGSLSEPIPRSRIEFTGKSEDADFWFFLDGEPGAHRGISCVLPCRIYKELPE